MARPGQFQDRARRFGGFWHSGRQSERRRGEGRSQRARNAAVDVGPVVNETILGAMLGESGPWPVLGYVGPCWGFVTHHLRRSWCILKLCWSYHLGPSLGPCRGYGLQLPPPNLCKPCLQVRTVHGLKSKRRASSCSRLH